MVFGIYGIAPPHTFWPYGGWGIAAAVLAPMVVVALVVRVIAGTKPLRG
jgi:hypothetical protein